MSVLICCYFIPLLISFIGMKKQPESDNLSKDATTSIRGIGMLLIIFAHAVESYVNTYTFFFYTSAILGVSACFLVSGYGLYVSYQKKDDYLKGFLLPKFARLLIPYLIFYALYLISSVITGNLPTIKQVGYELVTLQMDGLLLWYLKIQLLMYVFFFISFRFIKSEKVKTLLLFLLTVIYCIVVWRFGLKTYWYNTCIFFPIGVLLGKCRTIVIPIFRKRWCIIVSGFLTLMVLVFIYLFGRVGFDILIDSCYMLFFNVFMIGIFCRIGHSVFLNIIGKYSMEIYLAHLLLLNNNIYGLFSPEKGITYLLLIALTVAISAPVFYISNYMNKQLTAAVKKDKGEKKT